MLKIGDFSKLSRISIRMLRHYDELGLLVPKRVDSFTGYRHYGEEQLMTASRITALKEMGFTLSVIKEILQSYDNPKALAEFLSIKAAQVQAESEEIQRRMRLLKTTILRLREDETLMKYNVVVKELPERTVASVRKVIPSYHHEGMLWGILMEETAPLHLQDGDPCYTSAIFHDAEYKETDVDVEVQKTVKGSYKNTENVVFKTEPAVLVASATCKGSYEQMDLVNQAVANWVSDNGYEFAGKMFNIYHVSPHETQNPEEYVTEVCYPVKKK